MQTQKQITKLNFEGENIYVGIDTHKKDWRSRNQSEQSPSQAEQDGTQAERSRSLRHKLYSCVIISIPSANLIAFAAYLIGLASSFTGPLHHQIIIKN